MSLPEDYLSIDTPENVAFGYDVAGIGSRFLAAIVDTLLILLLQLIVNIPLLLLGRVLLDTVVEDDSMLLVWLGALAGLVAFAFFWGYYIFFEVIWNGQSPGKRWVGLRVLRTDGTPITLVESIVRNLVRLIDFLPIYYGIGVVTMFINDQSRRLGDLAAGTLVVHDRDTVTLESLAATTKAPGAPPPSISAEIRQLPLDRLTERDVQVVEDFLRRRLELANTTTMAKQLLQMLFERMDQPTPQPHYSWETERMLADIVQAYRNRAIG